MATIINIDRKINLLALDIKAYMLENKIKPNATPVNIEKCAWVMAVCLKDGLLCVDELDEAIISYVEVIDDAPQRNGISQGNLSQAMREDFMERGLSINEIHHKMGCKYVRVKNVIKKIPNWKTIEEKNKKAELKRKTAVK